MDSQQHTCTRTRRGAIESCGDHEPVGIARHWVGLMLCLGIALCALGCQVAQPRVSVSTSQGESRLRWDLPGRNDRGDSQLLRIRAELDPKPGEIVGGGLDLEFANADDDFFASATVAGHEPAAWNTFLFAAIHPPLHRFFKLPIRVGPTIRYFRLESRALETEWVTIGLRGHVSPEVVLLSSQRHAEELAIFGDVSGYAGRANAETDFDRVDRHDHDRGGADYGYGLEAGLRYRFQQLEIRGSWLHQRSEIDEIDRFINSDIPAIRQRFDGFTLSVGIYF